MATSTVRKIDNRKDILLLLLFSPGKTDQKNETITGRTRIVKMLFLFKNEVLPHFRKGTAIDEENFYSFFPWNFGPFSTQVYDDLNFFLLRGFIGSTPSVTESLPESAAEWEKWFSDVQFEDDEAIREYNEEEFALSNKGLAYVESKLWSALSDNQKNLLTQFKAKTVSAPLRGLLHYVYSKYPSMTDRSLIKDEILGPE